MKNFKSMLVMGFLLVLSQGCSVYQSENSTVEEAIQSQDPIRIVTTDNVFYHFKSLQRENGELYGIARSNSGTAKMLQDHLQINDGKYLKIALPEDEILRVYLKNKGMSSLVNIGVPVVGAVGLIGVTSENFRPDVGY